MIAAAKAAAAAAEAEAAVFEAEAAEAAQAAEAAEAAQAAQEAAQEVVAPAVNKTRKKKSPTAALPIIASSSAAAAAEEPQEPQEPQKKKKKMTMKKKKNSKEEEAAAAEAEAAAEAAAEPEEAAAAAAEAELSELLSLLCDPDRGDEGAISPLVASVSAEFRRWVLLVAQEDLHMPPEFAAEAGGAVLLSGSHRMGLCARDSDVDLVGLAPHFCTPRHFFARLAPQLTAAGAECMTLIDSAWVPVLSFLWRGAQVDLALARSADSAVPPQLDEAAVLASDRACFDMASVRALNGPRTTDALLRLVGGGAARAAFLEALRCVRLWAQRRGLYSNKLGFLGGVNCAILVAHVSQQSPAGARAPELVRRFFEVFAGWAWPAPVELRGAPPTTAGEWGGSAAAFKYVKMPMLTPTVPAANAAHSVCAHSFAVITQELARGRKLVGGGDCDSWRQLFAPSDFFERHAYYLACHIVVAPGADRGWTGFVESKLRFLTARYYLESLTVRHPIVVYPTPTVVGGGGGGGGSDTVYYLGLDPDPAKKGPDVTAAAAADCVARFTHTVLLDDAKSGYAAGGGVDFYAELVTARAMQLRRTAAAATQKKKKRTWSELLFKGGAAPPPLGSPPLRVEVEGVCV